MKKIIKVILIIFVLFFAASALTVCMFEYDDAVKRYLSK